MLSGKLDGHALQYTMMNKDVSACEERHKQWLLKYCGDGYSNILHAQATKITSFDILQLSWLCD